MNKTIEKIMSFQRSFNKMSADERRAWALEMGQIRIEDFYKANQMVFDEDGASERNPEKRAFFLELLQTQVVSDAVSLKKGHPVSNYLAENLFIRQFSNEAKSSFASGDFAKTLEFLHKLKGVHIHYLRKEDQLFPYLEKHGFTYPSVGMWKFHDELRDRLKSATQALSAGSLSKEESDDLLDVLQNIHDMTIREEKMLLPASLHLLGEDEWAKIAKEEREIGFVFIDEPPFYTDQVDKKPNDFATLGLMALHDGALSKEQLEMFFAYLPIDVTIVDENDKVAFFNKGDNRTFVRSAGVIGREVRFCHPPKSVHIVLEILEAFKNGTKDDAEFWINFKGRLIHIRYFALRDSTKNYKGVMEITQDITDIQQLKGEKRLLEWN